MSSALYAETEGNPLFLVSLLQTWFEDGLISSAADGSWLVDMPALLTVLRVGLPGSTADAILSRVERLAVDERQVLEAAAPPSHRGALTDDDKATCESRPPPRVQGASADPNAYLTSQRKVVTAFLAASRHGDFAALLAVLDPDVVLRSDRAAEQAGAAEVIRGAAAVAANFAGRARAAQPALINGAAGAVWAPLGRPHVVFAFTITSGKIAAIEILADPERLNQLDIIILDS